MAQSLRKSKLTDIREEMVPMYNPTIAAIQIVFDTIIMALKTTQWEILIQERQGRSVMNLVTLTIIEEAFENHVSSD